MPELPAAAAAQLAAQLAELGEEFRRSLPERVRQIEAALMALGEDREAGEETTEAALRELSVTAHRLAGAAGTFGHPLLGATARQMEELANRLKADPAARLNSARVMFDALLATLCAAAEKPAPTNPAVAADGALDDARSTDRNRREVDVAFRGDTK